MGLYKKGRMWYVAVTANGRQFHRSTHTTSKRMAKRILAKIEVEITENRFALVRSDAPKFDLWADQFLESIQHSNTKRAYKSCVVALKRFFANSRLSDMSASRIEDFKQSRLKSGTGPATINRSLQVLRRMMKLAERQRLISRSPFNEVELLNERSTRRQAYILTFEEQKRLVACSSPLLRAFIYLVTETGLRSHREALLLKWQEVDFADEMIHILQSKTVAGRRIVPLSKLCTTELQRWRRMTGPSYSPFVFPNSRNEFFHLKSIRKPWVGALKKAKIAYFPIYCLRATFASRLSAAGVPDVFVSGLLGHAGGLLQTYSKAITDFRRDAIRNLEEYRQSKVTDELCEDRSSRSLGPSNSRPSALEA
jgi:integrase